MTQLNNYHTDTDSSENMFYGNPRIRHAPQLYLMADISEKGSSEKQNIGGTIRLLYKNKPDIKPIESQVIRLNPQSINLLLEPIKLSLVVNDEHYKYMRNSIRKWLADKKTAVQGKPEHKTKAETKTDTVDIYKVADYFIANADPDEGINSLKLQKLCCYAQAFSLALDKQRLFDATLEASTNGPVVKELFELHPPDGIKRLTAPVQRGQESFQPFTDKQLFVLGTVNEYYGCYATRMLRDLSIGDFPGDFGGSKETTIPDGTIMAKFSEHEAIINIEKAYR